MGEIRSPMSNHSDGQTAIMLSGRNEHNGSRDEELQEVFFGPGVQAFILVRLRT